MTTEEILVFLKPDAVIRRGVGARVIRELIDNGEFEIGFFGEVHPPREFIATKHYVQHKEKFFYEWLVEYVTSSPLLVFVLRGESVIYKVRTLLGSTIPENADCNTIRGKYGIIGGINVAHASDNVDNGYQEVSMWRNIIKVQDCNYTQKANEYTEKYIHFPIIGTERYREISKLLMEKKITQEDADDSFTSLLLKESDFNDEIISHFTTVMIKNALLREDGGE